MKFKTTQFLILIIIANVFAAAGYYFLLNQINKDNVNAVLLMDKIRLGQERNSRFGDLQATVNNTEAERQQMLSLLLPSGSAVSFVEQIETIATSSNLVEKTNSLSETPSQTGGLSKLLDIQLTTSGSWSNTIFFLNQIENLPYDISIKNLSLNEQAPLTPKSSNTWTAVYDFSVVEGI